MSDTTKGIPQDHRATGKTPDNYGDPIPTTFTFERFERPTAQEFLAQLKDFFERARGEDQTMVWYLLTALRGPDADWAAGTLKSEYTGRLRGLLLRNSLLRYHVVSSKKPLKRHLPTDQEIKEAGINPHWLGHIVRAYEAVRVLFGESAFETLDDEKAQR